MLPWIEKYRPEKFEDIIGIEDFNLNINDLQHMLFISSAGTGKTTVAKALIKELDADNLIINASDDRKIETVREKIKSFAMTNSLRGKGKKIIFLDEADGLTSAAQDSLKNIIEEYSNNCVFILTTNHINKITDPIQSRCRPIKFGNPNKNKILLRLKQICEKENLIISDELLKIIIERKYPDIRRCVVYLQELSHLNRPIEEKDLDKEKEFITELFLLMKTQNKFEPVRQFILDSNIDYEGVLVRIYEYIMKNRKDFPNVLKLINILRDCNRYLKIVVSKEIEFEPTILLLMEQLKK